MMNIKKFITYSCLFISIAIFSSCNKDEISEDTFPEDLIGTWIYAWSYSQDDQEYSQSETYIFDSNNRGCGPVIDNSYDFSYEILNEDDGFHTLVLKYENDNEIKIFKEVTILKNSLRLNNSLYKRQ